MNIGFAALATQDFFDRDLVLLKVRVIACSYLNVHAPGQNLRDRGLDKLGDELGDGETS